MPVFDRVAGVAATHHGVVTYDQLRALGATERAVRTWCAQGVLRRAARGIYVVARAPPSWLQEVAVAVRSGGPLALAGARCAAGLWRFDRFRRRHVEVVVEAPAPRRRPGLHVIQTTRLPARDRTVLHGIAVTTPTRTLIDMGRFVGAARLGAMVDDAVRRSLTTYEDLHLRFAELASRGRPGIATMREVLERRPCGAEVPDSQFELDVRDLLVRAGLPEPVLHHRVDCGELAYVLDLAWPNALVALECDGFRFHRTPDQLEWDDRRRNALGLRGWLVLHTTWWRHRDDPIGLVGEVRHALARRT